MTGVRFCRRRAYACACRWSCRRKARASGRWNGGKTRTLNARIKPRRPTLTRRGKMRFSDRVVIVTGGAGGIGLATAKRFGSEGARVVIADLDQEKADAAANELRRAGAPDAFVFACNVAEEAQAEA